MKFKFASVCWTLALAGATISWCAPAQAQNAVTSGVSGRLSVVELRDTNLADALEMIFQAAGNPSHIIDEQAKDVSIPATTLNNIAWDAAVRNLTQLNGYKVSRNEAGTYIIEPRVVAPPEGGFPGEGNPFGGPGSPFAGGAPGNPFSRGGGGGRGRGGVQASPDIRTNANPQTRPNIGGRGGGAATNTVNPNEGKDYKLIIVKHIYAGGLAQLFGNASVINTQDFVSPGTFNSSGGGGGFGGGGGGFGGGGGGFGGGGGGFGGGGLGGGGGGFGGGGGGFGGSSGGFGGGGGLGGGGGGFGGGLGF